MLLARCRLRKFGEQICNDRGVKVENRLLFVVFLVNSSIPHVSRISEGWKRDDVPWKVNRRLSDT